MPEVGVELFRLNHIRLRVGLEGLLPFYAPSESPYRSGLLIHARVAF